MVFKPIEFSDSIVDKNSNATMAVCLVDGKNVCSDSKRIADRTCDNSLKASLECCFDGGDCDQEPSKLFCVRSVLGSRAHCY